MPAAALRRQARARHRPATTGYSARRSADRLRNERRHGVRSVSLSGAGLGRGRAVPSRPTWAPAARMPSALAARVLGRLGGSRHPRHRTWRRRVTGASRITAEIVRTIESSFRRPIGLDCVRHEHASVAVLARRGWAGRALCLNVTPAAASAHLLGRIHACVRMRASGRHDQAASPSRLARLVERGRRVPMADVQRCRSSRRAGCSVGIVERLSLHRASPITVDAATALSPAEHWPRHVEPGRHDAHVASSCPSSALVDVELRGRAIPDTARDRCRRRRGGRMSSLAACPAVERPRWS